MSSWYVERICENQNLHFQSLYRCPYFQIVFPIARSKSLTNTAQGVYGKHRIPDAPIYPHTQAKSSKIIQPDLAILSPRTHPGIAQRDTGNRPRMTPKRPLAPSSPRIPHLYHSVLSATYNAQCVSGERPNAFYMPEERTHADVAVGVPEPDGGV